MALVFLSLSCKNNTSGTTPALAWVVSTLAGSTEGFREGIGTDAQFNDPGGVAVDLRGNVYVADMDNDRIRKIEYKVP